MVKIYSKLHKGMEVLKFFTVRDWDWTHKNMDILRAAMSHDDQKVRHTHAQTHTQIDIQTYGYKVTQTIVDLWMSNFNYV